MLLIHSIVLFKIIMVLKDIFLALWPGCRQAPHNRFDGGFEVEGVMRVGGVVMVV